MTQPVLTQQTIEEFLQALKSEQKNKKAVAEYSSAIYGLKQIFPEEKPVLTKEALEHWRLEVEASGLSPGTITNRAARINAYLRYIGHAELCFPRGRHLNLTGKQFGSLMVLEETDRISADRSHYWKCRCELCGKEKEIPANQLMRGVQVSCGCSREKRLQETNGYVDGTCLKLVLSDKISISNKSGCKGVFQKRGKWTAQISYKKKTYYLGSYERFEDAVKARQEAEERVRDDAEQLAKELEQQRTEHRLAQQQPEHKLEQRLPEHHEKLPDRLADRKGVASI